MGKISFFGTGMTSADFQMGGKPLSNRSVENCSQRFTEIRRKIAQEPIWEAIRPRSFKYIYACKAVCNLYGIRTIVIIKLS